MSVKNARITHTVFQYSELVFLVKGIYLVGTKLTLRQFKLNTSGWPFSVYIHRHASEEFCPVLALHHFCLLQGAKPGPLFCLQDNLGVSTPLFNTPA